jgi:hypothetical protein
LTRFEGAPRRDRLTGEDHLHRDLLRDLRGQPEDAAGGGEVDRVARGGPVQRDQQDVPAPLGEHGLLVLRCLGRYCPRSRRKRPLSRNGRLR